jgi:hypothetical protein
MFDPFSWSAIVIVIITTVVGLALWSYIANVMAEYVIPFIRNNISNSVADAIAGMFDWLDGKVVLARSAAKAAFNLFKTKVLGFKATYKKTGIGTISRVTRVTVKDERGAEHTLEQEEDGLSRDVAPAEALRAMNRDARKPVEIDLMPRIDQAVAEAEKKLPEDAEVIPPMKA